MNTFSAEYNNLRKELLGLAELCASLEPPIGKGKAEIGLGMLQEIIDRAKRALTIAKTHGITYKDN